MVQYNAKMGSGGAHTHDVFILVNVQHCIMFALTLNAALWHRIYMRIMSWIFFFMILFLTLFFLSQAVWCLNLSEIIDMNYFIKTTTGRLYAML